MDVNWQALAPCIAIVIIIVAMQARVRAAGLRRARDYASNEDKTRQTIAARFPLPTVPPSIASSRLKSLSDLVSTVHEEAVEAQTTYHSAVVRSATCLAVAFCALALSATPLKAHLPFELVLAWVDAIAIGLVIYHFL